MAGLAVLVIAAWLAYQWLVRIVTSKTGESSIGLGPASTRLQPIRREAKRETPAYAKKGHVDRCPVTCPTEINRCHGAEPGRVENQAWCLRILRRAHERHMLSSRTVTRFAGDPRNQVLRIEVVVGCRLSAMATKTSARVRDEPP